MRKGNLMAGAVNLGSKQPSREISRSPLDPRPGAGAKGWEVLRGKNATKFGPNLSHTSSCGLIFPAFVGAIQARWIPQLALITHGRGGRGWGSSKCESSIKSQKFFLSLESALWVGGEWKTPLQLISNSFLCISLGGTKRVVEKSIFIQLKLFLLSSCLNDMVFNKNRQPVLSNQFRINQNSKLLIFQLEFIECLNPELP